MSNFDITTKTGRLRLKVRRDPYFHDLGDELSLGYRRGADTWVARLRQRGEYVFQALGQFAEFNLAAEAARAWRATMSGGASRVARRGTVEEALTDYIQHLKDINRTGTAVGAETRFDNVAGTALASVRMPMLTLDDFKEWRTSLLITKERVTSTGKVIDPIEREPQSVNRIVSCVQAALTWAIGEGGYVGNRGAWRLADLGVDEEAPRCILKPVQRAHLLSHMQGEILAFNEALQETGARPHEMAKALVGDFDAANAAITLRDRKGSGKVRTRQTSLSPAGVALFKRQAKGKLPGAYLFISSTGKAMTKNVWCRNFRKAADRANEHVPVADPRYIPDRATSYSFRHAFISELLQVHRVDSAIVCRETGTSRAMLEKYYYHFIPGLRRDIVEASTKAA